MRSTRRIEIIKDYPYLFKPNGHKSFGYWNNVTNVLLFLKNLQNELNLQTQEQWDLLNTRNIKDYGGGSLLNKYSLFELKTLGFPEGKFKKPNKRNQYGHWNNNENVKEFLNKLQKKLNLQSNDDWNTITVQQIKDNGGSSLLMKYSIFELKSLGISKGNSTNVNNISFSSGGFWNKEANIQDFLDNLREKYNLQSINDWNTLQAKQIKKLRGGSSILSKFSLFEIKCMGNPNGKLLYNKSKNHKSSGYWENKENIQKFLLELKEKENLNTFDDWNSLTQIKILQNGGGSLLKLFSMYDIKCLGCPNEKHKFKKPSMVKPSGYWDNQDNIRDFISKLKMKFNLQTPNDWNLITQKHIQSIGGSTFVRKFSMYEIKCMGCPDGNFLFSKPNQYKSSKYWKNEDNIKNFVENFAKKFNIQSVNDWKRISKDQIISFGGSGLLKEYSIDNLVNKFNFDNFSTNETQKFRSSQRWLFLQVQKIFPHGEIVEDYFHSEISRNSSFHVQFDIFLVNLNIAIEYHGRQHYEDIPNAGFASLELYKIRDEEKAKLCKQFGIKLIIIPYWWDNNLDSLLKELEKNNAL